MKAVTNEAIQVRNNQNEQEKSLGSKGGFVIKTVFSYRIFGTLSVHFSELWGGEDKNTSIWVSFFFFDLFRFFFFFRSDDSDCTVQYRIIHDMIATT